MTLEIGIYNHTTGEQSTREMTQEELANHQAEIAKNANTKATKAAEKEQAKEALLATLGITEQQAIVLGLL